jgi:hypothetical protein
MKNLEFTMAVDYFDLIWQSEELFLEEQINRFLGECAERGISKVQWRLSGCGNLLYHTQTPDRYGNKPFPADVPAPYANLHKPIYEKCCKVMEKIDPLEVAVRIARKHGLKIHPWLTLFDDYGYGLNISSLVHEHPEYCWKSKNGNDHYLGVLSYVYPEVRKFRMRQIEEILRYGADGLYLSNRSHSRPAEYHRKIRKFMDENTDKPYSEWIKANQSFIRKVQGNAQEQYGFDPPAVEAFREKYGVSTDENPDTWWRFRGSYFTSFLKEVSEKVKQENQQLGFGLRYDPDCPHFVYGNRFFNWKTMSSGQILDEIHYNFPEVDNPDYQSLFPEIETSEAKRFGWVWMGAKNLEKTIPLKVTPLAQPLSEGIIDGITLFEAYHFMLYPELWNIINYIRKGEFSHEKQLETVYAD